MHIFIPIGININQDVNMMNALQRIKELRGEFGHKMDSIKSFPNIIQTYQDILDIFKLCEDIHQQITEKFETET